MSTNKEKITEKRKGKKKGQKRVHLNFSRPKIVRHVFNPVDQVPAQVHHLPQTTSKDEHTALLVSSFAITWEGKMTISPLL